MAVIPVVLSQHTEEAAFLWLLRNAAVHQPHYSLSDLAHHDGRIDAHLDGLRIAGDEGWESRKGQSCADLQLLISHRGSVQRAAAWFQKPDAAQSC